MLIGSCRSGRSSAGRATTLPNEVPGSDQRRRSTRPGRARGNRRRRTMPFDRISERRRCDDPRRRLRVERERQRTGPGADRAWTRSVRPVVVRGVRAWGCKRLARAMGECAVGRWWGAPRLGDAVQRRAGAEAQRQKHQQRCVGPPPVHHRPRAAWARRSDAHRRCDRTGEHDHHGSYRDQRRRWRPPAISPAPSRQTTGPGAGTGPRISIWTRAIPSGALRM